MAERLQVKGYREFLRACDRAGRDSKKFVRDAYRDVGVLVRDEARSLFDVYSHKSAEGYTVSVRQNGVSVMQRLRKTTGTRPDFGALQMRKALIPARSMREEDVERAFEHAIDKVADHFDH